MAEPDMIKEVKERVRRNNSFSVDKWMSSISVKTESNDHLKHMILNYFVSEGYESAANHFAKEAGLKLGERNVELIRIKDKIRLALHKRNVTEVIEELNKFDASILMNNELMTLQLDLVTFCGMIISLKFEEALDFIRDKAMTHLEAGEHIELIETHLQLLSMKDPMKSPAASLLSDGTILDLNTQINKELNQRLDAEIIALLKLVKWMERRLSAKMKVPKLANVSKLQFSLQ